MDTHLRTVHQNGDEPEYPLTVAVRLAAQVDKKDTDLESPLIGNFSFRDDGTLGIHSGDLIAIEGSGKGLRIAVGDLVLSDLTFEAVIKNILANRPAVSTGYIRETAKYLK